MFHRGFIHRLLCLSPPQVFVLLSVWRSGSETPPRHLRPLVLWDSAVLHPTQSCWISNDLLTRGDQWSHQFDWWYKKWSWNIWNGFFMYIHNFTKYPISSLVDHPTDDGWTCPCLYLHVIVWTSECGTCKDLEIIPKDKPNLWSSHFYSWYIS